MSRCCTSSPSPSRLSTARRTCSVAAVISGQDAVTGQDEDLHDATSAWWNRCAARVLTWLPGTTHRSAAWRQVAKWGAARCAAMAPVGVELVEDEVVVVGLVLADVEEAASGLVRERALRVLVDGGDELLEPAGHDLERDDKGDQGDLRRSGRAGAGWRGDGRKGVPVSSASAARLAQVAGARGMPSAASRSRHWSSNWPGTRGSVSPGGERAALRPVDCP